MIDCKTPKLSIAEFSEIELLARKYPNNSEFGYFSRIVLKEKAYGLSPNDYEFGEFLRNKIKSKNSLIN